jgi:hypothetical protein
MPEPILPMWDIFFGILINLSISTGLFMVGLRLGRHASARILTVPALVAAFLIILHAFLLSDSLYIAKVLPFSNVMVFANPMPPAGGLLAGIVCGRARRVSWRAIIVVALLVVVSLYAAYGRFLGKPPRCEDYWKDGVCIQTSPASCSAAGAATLLRSHGIPATEAEMASICFTREAGTTMSGLYRGLKIKTADTEWDAKAFFCEASELRAEAPLPAIIKVWLDKDRTNDPRYEQEWGWKHGIPHTVVLFRFVGNGEVEVGDPSVGRERWRFEDVKALWHGAGIGLVRR